MLEEKLRSLPDRSGVYLMKDYKDTVIYVGKANSLKSRVRSYFSSQHPDSPKTRVLVSHIRDLEYIITDSEVEALILESNLIKKHKPRYNVRLTDDKHYPYLRVTLQEAYPRLEIVRSLKKDGNRYFGPYTDAGAVHETLRLLKKLFPVRSCKQSDFSSQARPCLNAHIKRCGAPCSGAISQEQYRGIINQVILFLEGRQEELLKILKERMEQAAEDLEFEKAAGYRDQLQAIEKVITRQIIISDRYVDMDVIHYARGTQEACVQVFFVRGGKILGRDHFLLKGSEGSQGREILSAFLQQYYNQVEFIPGEILLPETVEDQEILQDWLGRKKGSRVYLKIPKAGHKRSLLEMAGKNALEALQQELLKQAAREKSEEEALGEITRALNLHQMPEYIECYDISHIQGAETVASMVVFTGGRPSPSAYRRFKIKTVEGPDDFASMGEVIRRRFQRFQAGDERFVPLPDLVVIDGGKGQLSSARLVMKELGFGHIPAVGLAKENEWLFLEDRSDPLVLPRQSRGLYLLQRIRDEAHRYALAYHRLLRGRRNLSSALDEIPGIGPKRKEVLLRHFGLSLKRITNATVEELAEVKGISRDAAREIWDYFHPPAI